LSPPALPEELGTRPEGGLPRPAYR